MQIVFWICGVQLALAAVGTLYRIWRGPTLLDRVLATDVMLSIIIAVICVNMVVKDSYELLTLIVVLAMVGFIGSVTVARFANNTPSHEKRLKPSRIQEMNPNDPGAKRRREVARRAAQARKSQRRKDHKKSAEAQKKALSNPQTGGSGSVGEEL